MASSTSSACESDNERHGSRCASSGGKGLSTIRSQCDVIAKVASLEKELRKVKRQAQKSHAKNAQLSLKLKSRKNHTYQARKISSNDLREIQMLEKHAKSIIPDPPRLEDQVDNDYLAWEGQVRAKLTADAAILNTEAKRAGYIICSVRGVHARRLAPSLARNPNMTVEHIFRILRRYCVQTMPPPRKVARLYKDCVQDSDPIHEYVPLFLGLADILGVPEEQQIRDLTNRLDDNYQEALENFKPKDLDDLLREIYELEYDLENKALILGCDDIALYRGNDTRKKPV